MARSALVCEQLHEQRLASLGRLRSVWDGIIAKYSCVFDDDDEIDLLNESVVVNNGFLDATDELPLGTLTGYMSQPRLLSGDSDSASDFDDAAETQIDDIFLRLVYSTTRYSSQQMRRRFCSKKRSFSAATGLPMTDVPDELVDELLTATDPIIQAICPSLTRGNASLLVPVISVPRTSTTTTLYSNLEKLSSTTVSSLTTRKSVRLSIFINNSNNKVKALDRSAKLKPLLADNSVNCPRESSTPSPGRFPNAQKRSNGQRKQQTVHSQPHISKRNQPSRLAKRQLISPITSARPFSILIPSTTKQSEPSAPNEHKAMVFAGVVVPTISAQAKRTQTSTIVSEATDIEQRAQTRMEISPPLHPLKETIATLSKSIQSEEEPDELAIDMLTIGSRGIICPQRLLPRQHNIALSTAFHSHRLLAKGGLPLYIESSIETEDELAIALFPHPLNISPFV